MKRLLIVCLFCAPVAAWALYKPMRVLAPDWFTEGMACSLSGTQDALGEPWKGCRDRFDAWYRGVGREALWEAARELR